MHYSTLHWNRERAAKNKTRLTRQKEFASNRLNSRLKPPMCLRVEWSLPGPVPNSEQLNIPAQWGWAHMSMSTCEPGSVPVSVPVDRVPRHYWGGGHAAEVGQRWPNRWKLNISSPSLALWRQGPPALTFTKTGQSSSREPMLTTDFSFGRSRTICYGQPVSTWTNRKAFTSCSWKCWPLAVSFLCALFHFLKGILTKVWLTYQWADRPKCFRAKESVHL